MPPWKRAVARAFDRAEDYESAAAIQPVAAAGLARSIAAETLAPAPRVLEIGCGTGLLTRALRETLPDAAMVVSDIAPAMVARCRTRMGQGFAGRFLVMDAEAPCLSPGFDLVASNLAAQWFEDLPATLAGLAGLLAPGGLLAVTTLAAGTFREWADAHAAVGLVPGTPAYPEVSELRAMSFAGCTTRVSVAPLVEAHGDGRAFLRSLRAIGASTPAGRRALSPGALRRVLQVFEAGGASVTYAVATCLIRRD